MKKPPTPIEADTVTKVCAMPRDNVDWGGFWMLSDGYMVSIVQQKRGEPASAKISVPKRTFDRFIRWYTTGEWTARGRRNRLDTGKGSPGRR